MNNFNLNLFKYFYYVVYYEGFTNASKKLNVAQSALSYNVKTLEYQIDKKLIMRDNKNFELTEEGNNLYENLRPVFEVLNQNLEQLNSHTVEELTIGVRHGLSDFIFKDAINEFIKKFPNILVNVKFYSKLDTKKFNDDYDMIVDYEDYTNLINTSNKINICTLENVLVAGKELFELYRNVTSIKELENTKLISMCPNKKNGKFQKLCFDNSILFKNVILINEGTLCKKLIKDNVGICFINKNTIREELANDSIKEINIKEALFSDSVVLVYKKVKNVNIIKEFIDILNKQYEEVV